jgi:hypothetical protein
VSDSVSDVLFEPDPAFAAGWFVNDSLAQGALKHASIIVLDMIDEAESEAAKADPELDDFGPLGIFPTSVRTLLTPQLIEKIKLSANRVRTCPTPFSGTRRARFAPNPRSPAPYTPQHARSALRNRRSEVRNLSGTYMRVQGAPTGTTVVLLK